ncbi:DUF4303 domain-containing protein [Arachnia propionica]|uniref:DUF4303 domain-containing protein n=1 Tax=Arachnia propionica TaxID=1750 RepID=A0A3P1TA04_9ACTN|nr:DUF4303 domain-containing protein [Arachnia propionica]RRD06264.1 DUF4303 domain-containing protein [Arachnia propionica]
MAKVDLGSVEQAAVEQVLREVRRVRAEHPDERIYAAMFHVFYGDGEDIYWPCLSVGTEESLKTVEARYLERDPDDDVSSLRFSGADLPYMVEATEAEMAVAEGVNEYGLSLGGEDAWDEVYQQFLEVFPRAARKARKAAIDEGLVGEEFIVVALDEAMELVPACLTREQLERHFPELVAGQREEQRILALPEAERVQALLDISFRRIEGSPLWWERTDPLLFREGAAAVPGLVAVLEGRAEGERWTAARLAAGVNHATPELIAALERVLDDEQGEEATKGWAASALCALGRMELLAGRIGSLPEATIIQGLSHPFGPFRDQGNHAPLDYRPLEAVLEVHPEFDEKLLNHSGGTCEIDEAEVAEAERGTASKWKFIRDHAEDVLERYRAR